MKNLNELTVLEAIEGLKCGDFTSLDLVNACIDVIEKFEPKIKAFVTITKDEAISEAKKIDKEISLNKNIWDVKPLAGVPYVCKDNFSTNGIKTTASSKILENYVPPFDSTVVKQLKDAGAIMLGKTNMDAFAHGSSTETSDFFKTKNPHDLTRVPGGSSGGSAAAVAANMCIFGIGSETAGSIRGPAAWCGITGLKPTYGRVSRYGVVAMASSTDSPGPLTKNAVDAGYILKVIAGEDSNDATTSKQEVIDYINYAHNYSLKGKKIGMPKSYFDIELEEGVKTRVLEAVEAFKELGAEIVEMDLMDPKYSIAVYTILQRSEVSSNLARLDGIRYGGSRSDFGFEAKKRMMLGAYTLSAGYYDAFYAKAQKVRTLLINDLKKAFSKVDLIIAPTMPSIALKLGEPENNPLFGELMDVLAEQSSIAGICGISIPCGMSQGMPVGVQLMGNMFNEKELVGAAKLYQDKTDYHLKLPSLEKLI